MTSDSTTPKADGALSADEPRQTIPSQGWLASLRARLGLPAPTLRDTLEDALKAEAKPDTAFSAEERSMLLRLLRFGALRVVDLMVPRADIIAADENEPVADVLRRFVEAGVSRIPLYHDTLDDPRGMIHIKDLVAWLAAEAQGRPSGDARSHSTLRLSPAQRLSEQRKLADPTAALDLSRLDLDRPLLAARLRRDVLYVPPSMPAMNLLIRMQSTRIHMALVVDEYGGTDGLVTIEDLVEQIVGEIEDEHDDDADKHITVDPKLGLVASARTPIKELEEHLGVKVLRPGEDDDIDTLGGLIFALLGRVPARGELIRHPSGLELEVLDADPRRVKKLKVARTPQPPPAPASSAEK
jgi:CBS domain containing-hemolysin-like protein